MSFFALKLRLGPDLTIKRGMVAKKPFYIGLFSVENPTFALLKFQDYGQSMSGNRKETNYGK